MHHDRRRFLMHGLAAGALGISSARLWAAPQAEASGAGASATPRFLLVFLRGAYDAANLLVPYASPFYYESRPNIAIAAPGRAAAGQQAAVALDVQWGLAPSAADSMLPLYQRGELAFVPFAGCGDTSRSHFETQDTIELGQADSAHEAHDFNSGFLNRLAGVIGARPGATSEAMAFTDQLPLVMRGGVPLANQSLRDVGRGGVTARQADLISGMYAGTSMGTAVSEGFQVRGEVSRELADEMQAASRNAVNAKGFSLEARRMARLMRDRVALGFIDVGGWDTHVGQGGASGALAGRLGELSQGLAAFADEMGPQAWSHTTVVVLSEFGRTFRENGNRGTDHGHGSAYWVLGGAVKGGRIVGEQVELRRDTLFQGRDWPVLTDYRAMLGGVLGRMYGLNAAQLATIFPNAQPRDLGLV
ncbi:MAG: DUF1501 domain-containing protein [Paucibacter sp.]|nr:DUF1501 domain-containing protein [Roseateles sp.]